MNKEKHNRKHEGHEGHDHSDHDHSGHSHEGKSAVVLFFLGLVAYIVGLFIKDNDIIRNVLNISALVLSGYHIIIEGVTDTIKASIKARRFKPNIHLLMLVAAVGAMIIAEYREAALLILIFAGAHFLEEYAEGRSKRKLQIYLN
nr:hypothetical protein QOL21_03350 [Acholeplasma laidlawii]